MKRVLAAGAVAALIGVALPALTTARDRAAAARKPAAAHTRGWAVCREHLTLHISPALTGGASHPATLNISDVLESCSSSDRTINRGIANIKATSPNASCQSGDVNGVARIRWNNGRTSRVAFKASFAAGFARGIGHVVGGSEFVGRRFAALDHLNVDAIALQLCSTPSVGLSTLASDGAIAIGAPPTSDGVVWTP